MDDRVGAPSLVKLRRKNIWVGILILCELVITMTALFGNSRGGLELLWCLFTLPILIWTYKSEKEMGSRAPWTWAMLVCIPVVNLFVFLLIRYQIDEFLKTAGYKIGFFGIHRATEAERAASPCETPHERTINMNINAVMNFLWKDNRRRLCVAGVVLGLLLVCFPRLLYIPVADSSCQQYFKSSLQRAGASYLLCRSVIGGLDTIEHSQIGITPLGVGVDVEPARITDPLRDVAERASDVLFTAILTLTVEEIGYEVMRTLGVQVIGVVLLLISLAALFPRWSQRPIHLGIRVLVLLVALRLALPASAGLCTVVNAEIFTPKIAAVRESVAQVFPTKAVNALSDWSLPKASSGSWYEPRVIEAYGTYAFDKIAAFYKALGAITLHMKSMAEGLTVLSGLFVAQIIFQAVLLPLAVYWILIKICGLLFNWNLPPVLKLVSSRIGGASSTGQ